MFEEDIEYNYDELCDYIGYRMGDNDNDDGRSDDHDQYEGDE